MNRVRKYFSENYGLRPDWHVRFWAIIPALWGLNVGLALTEGENPTSVLYLAFFVYLFFGVDYVVYRYNKRQANKAEREAQQVERADEFGDRLDKSFGLDK